MPTRLQFTRTYVIDIGDNHSWDVAEELWRHKPDLPDGVVVEWQSSSIGGVTDDTEHRIARYRRYNDSMERAGAIYADVADAVGGRVSNTGGGCLAVIADGPTDDTYLMVTDENGPLPWDRDEMGRFSVGVYRTESDEEWAPFPYVDTVDEVATLVAAIRSGEKVPEWLPMGGPEGIPDWMED